MADRLALNAGRARIVRQLLVESLLLARVDGAPGLVLALATDRALLAFLPPDSTSLKPGRLQYQSFVEQLRHCEVQAFMGLSRDRSAAFPASALWESQP